MSACAERSQRHGRFAHKSLLAEVVETGRRSLSSLTKSIRRSLSREKKRTDNSHCNSSFYSRTTQNPFYSLELEKEESEMRMPIPAHRQITSYPSFGTISVSPPKTHAYQFSYGSLPSAPYLPLETFVAQPVPHSRPNDFISQPALPSSPHNFASQPIASSPARFFVSQSFAPSNSPAFVSQPVTAPPPSIFVPPSPSPVFASPSPPPVFVPSSPSSVFVLPSFPPIFVPPSPPPVFTSQSVSSTATPPPISHVPPPHSPSRIFVPQVLHDDTPDKGYAYTVINVVPPYASKITTVLKTSTNIYF